MAKSRSKSASTRKKSTTKPRSKSRTQSSGSAKSRAGSAGESSWRPGDKLDDIELLNVHRYPESMPPAVIAFVRKDRDCQRRLEELVKGTPGKRGQSGFNQLFQQKLDESEKQAPPPPPPPSSAQGASSRGPAAANPQGAPRQSKPSGGVGGFFRKLFS